MKSILVIEDDHDTRVTLRVVLESEGYFVFSAANGIDGLSTLQRINRPALIILDQNMPMMSGDEFLTLKNRDENFADIPVMVLSAVPDRCSRLGSVRFISKPFSTESFLGDVARLCNSPLTTSSPIEAAAETRKAE